MMPSDNAKPVLSPVLWENVMVRKSLPLPRTILLFITQARFRAAPLVDLGHQILQIPLLCTHWPGWTKCLPTCLVNFSSASFSPEGPWASLTLSIAQNQHLKRNWPGFPDPPSPHQRASSAQISRQAPLLTYSPYPGLSPAGKRKEDISFCLNFVKLADFMVRASSPYSSNPFE